MTNITTSDAPMSTSLAALLAALADRSAPLAVHLWADDGLAMARVVLTAGGHAIEVDVAYDAVGPEVPVSLEIPTLTRACERALAEAGMTSLLLGEHRAAKARIEGALATAQGHRIAAAIRAQLWGSADAAAPAA